MRVVDVGAGLCVIVAAPGPHYLIYDAGHWTGSHCFTAANEIIGEPTTTAGSQRLIDLMVLSHDDADHLGDAPKILDHYDVKEVFWTGWESETWTWGETSRRLQAAPGEKRPDVVNLQWSKPPRGTERHLGGAKVTFVAGWGRCPFPLGRLCHRRNAVSIVIRIDFDGKSLLLTGDTVGRKPPQCECIAAEQWMIDQNAVRPLLEADVLIAPHHGADNASCAGFIDAVRPKYVIFSAGSRHAHPRATTAQRFLDADVLVSRIFRTDRHDDEGPYEWDYLRQEGCIDPPADDDVEIRFVRGSKDIEVSYRNPDLVSREACSTTPHTTPPRPSRASRGTRLQ